MLRPSEGERGRDCANSKNYGRKLYEEKSKRKKGAPERRHVDDDDDDDDEESVTSEETNGDRDSVLATPTDGSAKRFQRKQKSQKQNSNNSNNAGEGRVTNAALAARLHITNSNT